MERDLDALMPLPPAPYDASDRHTIRVNSLSLVRYRTNDYSVPVAYGTQGGAGQGIRRHGGHQLRNRRDSQAPTLIRAGTTSCSIRSTTCRCWSARPVHWTRLPHLQAGTSPRSSAHCARLLESRMGRTRQEGVREGAQTHGDVQPEGRPQRGAGCGQAGSSQLGTRSSTWCCVVSRGGLPRLGPRAVSPSAQGERQHHDGQRDYMALLSGRAS